GPDDARVSLEGGALLSAGRVPQLDCPVPACRSQGLAVRAEGHGQDAARVSLEGGTLLAAGRVPQLDRPVPACRGDGLAVRAEGHGSDVARVSVECQAVTERPAVVEPPDEVAVRLWAA